MSESSSHTVLGREDAFDFMAQFPGYGEMRVYTKGLNARKVAFTWRSMPPGTGGKGSYGHRHTTQEEIYFVLKGKVTFKVEDELIELGPLTALRVAPSVARSLHNEGPEPAELVICSNWVEDPEADGELIPDFWPESAESEAAPTTSS